MAFGSLKNLSVFCPMFSAFGPAPVEERLRLGDVRVLVTTEELYRRKVAGHRERLPGLRHVLVTGPFTGTLPGTESLSALLADASDAFTIPDTDPEDMALLHFTSGTTGTPKGRSTFTRPSSPTMRRPPRPSTSTPTTSSGAPPTPAG
ncbi:AMP-binding protein [Kitasatospora paranensis]|uniref:AMP-binding protein n=1 Tax=Kitasatospora paranensis TaxID=258053 RepID=UPI0031F0FBFA